MKSPNPKATYCNFRSCEKEAVACLSPDMDIRGLCFCRDHEDDIRAAYIMILQGTPDMAKGILK